jgi:hypothetical protein
MSFYLVPPAIIREYKAEQKITKQSLSITDEESIIFSLFKGTNKCVGKDGRTYQYIDENGEYVSARVSPYSSNIFNNIEPGVKDLVLTLISKGYLTCSSCQGHSDRKYRFVSIAFNTKEQLNDFKSSIESFRLPVVFKFHNLKDPYDDFKLIYNQSKYKNQKLSVEDYKSIAVDYIDKVNYFNLMFFRSYEDYHLLELRIASSPDYDNLLWKRIITYPYYTILYFFRDRYTKMLTNKIKNELKYYEDTL